MTPRWRAAARDLVIAVALVIFWPILVLIVPLGFCWMFFVAPLYLLGVTVVNQDETDIDPAKQGMAALEKYLDDQEKGK